MKTIKCNLCGSLKHKLLFRDFDRFFNINLNTFYNVVQCDDCGLVFINPQPDYEELAVHYSRPDVLVDDSLKAADKDNFNKIKSKIIYHIKLNAVKAHLGYISGYKKLFWKLLTFPFYDRFMHYPKYKPQKRVLLDIGCSTGDWMPLANDLGIETMGIDMNENRIEFGRQKFGLNLKCARIENAGFADGYFDIVTMWNVIEHLYDPSETLKKIHRLLRNNGEIMIKIPNYDSYMRKVFGKCWEGYYVPRHLFVFTPETIRDLLSRNGFDVTKLVCFESAVIIKSSYRMLINKICIPDILKVLLYNWFVLKFIDVVFIPICMLGIFSKKSSMIFVLADKK